MTSLTLRRNFLWNLSPLDSDTIRSSFCRCYQHRRSLHRGVDLGSDSTDVTNTGGAYSWWTLVWHFTQWFPTMIEVTVSISPASTSKTSLLNFHPFIRNTLFFLSFLRPNTYRHLPLPPTWRWIILSVPDVMIFHSPLLKQVPFMPTFFSLALIWP